MRWYLTGQKATSPLLSQTKPTVTCVRQSLGTALSHNQSGNLGFNESWRFITVNWFVIATCLDYKVPYKDDRSLDPTIPTRYETFWTTVNSAPLHHSVREISSVHNFTFYYFQCPSSSPLGLLCPPPGLQVFRCLYGFFVSPCALHAPLILYLIF